MHLTRDVSTGPYSWRSETISLEKGDVITYVGKKAGLDHDNVDQDAFETEDGEQEKFSRQFWGTADRDALAPLD